jgi:hypothetical protein
VTPTVRLGRETVLKPFERAAVLSTWWVRAVIMTRDVASAGDFATVFAGGAPRARRLCNLL